MTLNLHPKTFTDPIAAKNCPDCGHPGTAIGLAWPLVEYACPKCEPQVVHDFWGSVGWAYCPNCDHSGHDWAECDEGPRPEDASTVRPDPQSCRKCGTTVEVRNGWFDCDCGEDWTVGEVR